MIVANADQLLIVVAPQIRPPAPGSSTAPWSPPTTPASPRSCWSPRPTWSRTRRSCRLISHYAELDLQTVVSQQAAGTASGTPTLDDAAVVALRVSLTERVTAMIGHSGVGKSTMVNALTGADRATSGVNAVTGRGRHTSSSAVALNLEPTDSLDVATARNSWIIDTPGVRTFGLAHVAPDDVLGAFSDLVEGSAACEPGCAHISPEGGCALDAWVADGHAGDRGAARLASLRGLIRSMAGTEDGPEEKRLGA